MAKCEFCNTVILFGGVREGTARFCNARCRQGGMAAITAARIAPDQLQELVAKVHQGPCPKCGGDGPVDVHYSHSIWSLVVVTRFASNAHVCCRSCAASARFRALSQASILGWWGFPWGIVMTPVQIGRNLTGLIKSPKHDEPSAELSRLIAATYGRAIVAQAQGGQPPPAPGADPLGDSARG